MTPDPATVLHGMLTGEDPGYLQFRFRYDGTEFDPGHPLYSEPTWVGPKFVNTDMRPVCLRLMRQEHSSVGAIPRRKPEPGYLARANVLWARLETGQHAEALARFRLAPTMVLREGKSPRRTALWALATGLTIDWAERANKRIAHRIGCKKKFAAAEHEIHPPGTTLTLGTRPALVWVEYMDPGALFMARGVVGDLADPPNPDAWRTAA